MSRTFHYLLLVLVSTCSSLPAQTINVRISAKLIDYGGAHNLTTEAQFDQMLAEANTVMGNQQRGLRFVRSEFNVISPNVPPPARYFDRDTGAPVAAPA